MKTGLVQIKEADEEAGDEDESDGTDYDDEQDFEDEDDDGTPSLSMCKPKKHDRGMSACLELSHPLLACVRCCTIFKACPDKHLL